MSVAAPVEFIQFTHGEAGSESCRAHLEMGSWAGLSPRRSRGSLPYVDSDNYDPEDGRRKKLEGGRRRLLESIRKEGGGKEAAVGSENGVLSLSPPLQPRVGSPPCFFFFLGWACVLGSVHVRMDHPIQATRTYIVWKKPCAQLPGSC